MERENLSSEGLPEPVSLDAKRAEKAAKFDELLEGSSLGSPQAEAIRSATPQEVSDRFLEALRENQGLPPVAAVISIKREKPGARTTPPRGAGN